MGLGEGGRDWGGRGGAGEGGERDCGAGEGTKKGGKRLQQSGMQCRPGSVSAATVRR